MPATVETDPPGIWCMFSGGSTIRFNLDGLPCPGLAEDLLTGLAGLVQRHGSVDAAGTAGVYVRAFREMTRTLAAAGFAGRAADMRRPHLTAFWMGTTADRESCTRRALAAFARDGGTLHPAVAELTAGRNFNPVFNHKPLPPYREAEWERLAASLRGGCRRRIRRSQGTRWPRPPGAASRARAGGPGRTSPGSWPGPGRSGRTGSGTAGCSPGVARRKSGFQQVSADLFPTLDTVIAYRLLFGICSGIVPDGIEDLVTRDIEWAGDAADPAVLCQAPHLRGEPEPAPPGSTAARAVAQPLGTAARPRRPGRPGTALAGHQPPRAGTRSSGKSTGSGSSTGYCATT